MAQTNFRNDTCFQNQQNAGNKTIFDYVIDTSAYINKNECFDSTPTFLSYIPVGTPQINVDLENELRGSNRANTRCSDCKFRPLDEILTSNDLQSFTTQNKLNRYPNNVQSCSKPFQILPNGYFNK